jgi:chorismate mutase / prephenate dehydratase
MPDAAPLAQTDDLAALRAEIDALDDAMHDLLMRRADVVARLAGSRAKGTGPALRPGREAAIVRRLLARHAGPFPRAGLLGVWRAIINGNTAIQAPMTVAACLDDAGLALLRDHLGLAASVTRCADAGTALGMQAAGRTELVALPPGGRWWRTLDPARLAVTARLPFLGAGAPVFLLSPVPPDPSGEDRHLRRVAAGALPEGGATLDRDGDHLLIEMPGFHAPGGAVIGAYAAPLHA